MQADHFFDKVLKAPLRGRFVCLDHLQPILERLPEIARVEVAGYSERGRPIFKVTLGHGDMKVLAWSQMHGNESTTTRAVMDLLLTLCDDSCPKQLAASFCNTYTLVVFPMLNPDGAEAYTRENANGVDLNRDAVELSQVESRILDECIREFAPQLCLNLHDQRSIYGLTGHKPATLSFLAPSADKEMRLTPSRKESMTLIAAIRNDLEKRIPGQIGRYDATFNPNCVGDKCSSLGIATILIEAGHYPGDYTRERTRELVYRAFLLLFGLLPTQEASYADYEKIPENRNCLRDVVVRNVRLADSDILQDLAIQYREEICDLELQLVPELDAVGNLAGIRGLKELDAKGQKILINDQQNIHIGMEISKIATDTPEKRILF